MEFLEESITRNLNDNSSSNLFFSFFESIILFLVLILRHDIFSINIDLVKYL